MLGGNKRKPTPVLKKAVVVEAVEAELPRPMFRGFIGGDAFITKKGYRGLRLDSLWVQNIFESFKTDDHELAAIALKSAIADVNDRVCGGVSGSPFSIGDYGFYAQTQFEPQMKFLQEKIQGIALQAKVYLSGSEWEEVEKKLLVLANHGYATFSRVAPGDSFAALAIRLSAFQVAKTLMNAGIDPLAENSEGKDMFDVMKEQYKELSTRLKETQDLKETAMRRIMVPTAVEHILSEECKLLDNFHFLSEFSDDLKVNLENRIVEINKDKILQRRAMLREEAFPDQKVWNIAQLDKAERYLQEIIELKGYIVEKIHFHEIHAVEFESLGTVLIANYKLLQQKDDRSVTSNSIASAEMESTPGNSRGTARRGSVMSRQSLASGLSSLQRDPSVISLKGDDESDRTPRVGFAFDDTSVLTEENPPSCIPILPHIPNRLKNSCIDGRRTVMQMRARKQKFVPVVEAPPDALAMLLKSEGRADTRVTADVLSPRSTGANLVSPRAGPESTTKFPALAALVIRPDSTATGKSHSDAPNQNEHESAQSRRRHNASSGGINSPSSRVGFDLPSRPGTADSERFSQRPGTADSFDSQFNDSSKPGTPSQKLRQSRSDKVVSKLSSKQELYEALGVADETEEESSVSSPVSRGGRSNTSAKQNIVPMTSAKLLAKSLRDDYAPVLGTFRQAENEVIMYR